MSRSCRLLPFVAVPLLLFTGCAARFATPAETVQRLFDTRKEFQGARSLSSVRITGKGGQSFRAAIAIDRDGDMAMSAFTPFGTTAAQIRVQGDHLILINHMRNQYWEGTIDQLSDFNPLAGALRLEGLPFLLTGLPPWKSIDGVRQEIVSDDLVRLSDRNLHLITGRSGIVGGRLEIGRDEVVVRFGSPAIPATKVEVSSSIDPTRIVQFEHLNLAFGPVHLDPLQIPSHYTRAEYWESLVR